MTRFTSLLGLGILACGAALAASQPQATTYVGGNLTGVAPNSGGTLTFSDDKSIYFRAGQATVPVPYESITKAELGAVKTRPRKHEDPIYKVWTLQKRFTGIKTQNLTVEFKGDNGEDKTMTVELSHSAAPVVLATIHDHLGGKSAANWWGDDYWKTARNADQWNKTVATNSSGK